MGFVTNMPSIIELAKRRWLVGLSWSSYEAAPSMSEIKEDAERLKSSWYCIRSNESVVQGGFCEPVYGKKRPSGLSSLAAKLADSHEQPWIGVFQLDENVWWYIAIRDGHAILPDGDLIGTAEEIRQARQNHAGYADWQYVEGDRVFLEDLVQGIKAKPSAIKTLERRNFSPIPLVAFAVFVLAASGGGYYWWTVQQQKEVTRLAEVKRIRDAAIAGNSAVVAPLSPLLSIPDKSSWLKACSEKIQPLPLVLMGWELSKVACAGESVNADWTRGQGATVALKPEGELASDGETVHQVIPLELTMLGLDDANDLVQAKIALRAWAQKAGFVLTLIEQAPVAALPGAEVVAAPMQLKTDFRLELSVSPFALNFPAIPGLRLLSIAPSDGNWTVLGVIYGH